MRVARIVVLSVIVTAVVGGIALAAMPNPDGSLSICVSESHPPGPLYPSDGLCQDGYVAETLGAQGPTGPTGGQGADGADGVDGADGATGAAGPAGLSGAAGPKGDQGVPGPTGATGPAGAAGATGLPGLPTSSTFVPRVIEADYAAGKANNYGTVHAGTSVSWGLSLPAGTFSLSVRVAAYAFGEAYHGHDLYTVPRCDLVTPQHDEVAPVSQNLSEVPGGLQRNEDIITDGLVVKLFQPKTIEMTCKSGGPPGSIGTILIWSAVRFTAIELPPDTSFTINGRTVTDASRDGRAHPRPATRRIPVNNHALVEAITKKVIKKLRKQGR